MSFKQVIQLRFYNGQKSIPNRPPRIKCSLFGKNNQHRGVQLVGIPTEEALMIAKLLFVLNNLLLVLLEIITWQIPIHISLIFGYIN